METEATARRWRLQGRDILVVPRTHLAQISHADWKLFARHVAGNIQAWWLVVGSFVCRVHLPCL